MTADDLDIYERNEPTNSFTTGWRRLHDGILETRERYLIRWERDEEEQTFTLYVRHEVQERESPMGDPWGTTTHDRDKELALLSKIAAEVRAATRTN